MYERDNNEGSGGAPTRHPKLLKINDLDTPNRNYIVSPTKNAASFAEEHGAKKSQETTQFPREDSPIWAGAPAIILRHFCGVAA